jgi:hypothetical protein
MPLWLKILLIVAMVVVLFIGSGVVWWMRNKDGLIAHGKEAAAEGKQFGQGTDSQRCVDEALSRYRKEPGLGSVTWNSIFMRMCLDESRLIPGFCDSVPKTTEFLRTAQWRIEQCSRIGLSNDTYCPNLFQPLQTFCERSRAGAL